jgi:hypothetical protein
LPGPDGGLRRRHYHPAKEKESFQGGGVLALPLPPNIVLFMKQPKIEPRIDPQFCCFRLRVGTSRIHRWGVYALEPIPSKRKVIEYTGEMVSRKEAKKRGSGKMTYLFTLDSYWCKDGAVGGSGAELINHSCDPNIRAVILKGHILYMSKRAIRKGEELTVDYNFDKDVATVHCKCGAKNCRGTINN